MRLELAASAVSHLLIVVIIAVCGSTAMSYQLLRAIARQKSPGLMHKPSLLRSGPLLQMSRCAPRWCQQHALFGSDIQPKMGYQLPALEAPVAHANCNSWVIFSDLHVKGSSIDVCEEVLHQVHEAAKLRDAGIIFLGDFWHVRGALSVELLNRVLGSLSKWECPVIMIPGNHDQVLHKHSMNY
jgi:hypothetical protein